MRFKEGDILIPINELWNHFKEQGVTAKVINNRTHEFDVVWSDSIDRHTYQYEMIDRWFALSEASRVKNILNQYE